MLWVSPGRCFMHHPVPFLVRMTCAEFMNRGRSIARAILTNGSLGAS